MSQNKKYITKSTLLNERAWTERAIGLFLNAPDLVVPNPHYPRSAPPMRLFLLSRVEDAEATDAFTRWRGERRIKPAAKEWSMTMRERYGTPANAIGDAADALFNLNGYARRATCSRAHRAEIHALKSAFIETMYARKVFTDRVISISRTLPAKLCFVCDGSGYNRPPFYDDANVATRSADDDDDYSDGCDRCNGTGWYQQARDAVSYVFHFAIEGKHYCWIQPDDALSFEPKADAEEKDDGSPRELEPALTISRDKLSEGKAIVRYALAEGAASVGDRTAHKLMQMGGAQ